MKSQTNREIINLRGHHLKVLSYILYHGPSSFKDIEKEAIAYGYGGKNAKAAKEIYSRIMSKERVKIKLIAELDDICKDCGRYIPRCSSPLEVGRSDRFIIESYRLMCEKVYTNKKIIKRLKILK